MPTSYQPPQVTATRTGGAVSPVVRGGGPVPYAIGRSNGKTSTVKAFAATMGAGNYTFSGLGTSGPVTRLLQVRDKISGGLVYLEGSDYTFDTGTQIITWLGVALAAPYLKTVAEISGGILSSATPYYYVVTAYRTIDNTGPSVGETAASGELTITPSAASKGARLTWQPVVGAEGYKIYRSIATGNYAGSCLLATVVGGDSVTYDDTSATPSTGSPPGIAVYATVLAANAAPYDLVASGKTVPLSIDGAGDVTATFLATRASRTCAGATYNVTIDGTNDVLSLKFNGGTTQSPTIPHAAYTLDALVIALNALYTGGFFDESGGQLRINSDTLGTGSSVQVVASSAVTILGATAGTTTGTGNVANVRAVTAAEVCAVLTAVPITGATCTIDSATGRPIITRTVSGLSHTLQVNVAGTAVATIGFPTTLATGNTATASTAVRKPPLHAGSANFYADYQYLGYDHLKAKVFTNLADVETEHGLGSDLYTAAKLMMSTAGDGNGAPVIGLMSVADGLLTSYQAALVELQKSRGADLIVPCTVVSGIVSALQAHVTTMSNATNKRDRRGIFGFAIGTMPGDADTSGTVIYTTTALDEPRMIASYPWPFINKQAADGTFTETEMDGWAGACVLAGLLAALPDRATPPTRKNVGGITQLGYEFHDESAKNLVAGAGACLFDFDGVNHFVRDGITTSVANEQDAQIAIGLAEDQIRGQLRTDFLQFAGSKFLPDVAIAVVERTKATLRVLKKSPQIIVGFNEASVLALQGATATSVKVRFSYQPINQLKEIDFEYTFDLSSPVSVAAA